MPTLELRPESLAWFAIGYAHYLDAQYPAAIAALQKAQPQIGELKDYTAFFIGNSFVSSNNPEEAFAYLRDFGTRFPDSLYAHDALISYARALLATNRSAEAVRAAGGAPRAGQRRDRILSRQSLRAEWSGPHRSGDSAPSLLQLCDQLHR